MRQQIRKCVFETNSSTSHTLTISKNKKEKEGFIPSNTDFIFSNTLLNEINEYHFVFHTEQEKLALCAAFCKNFYTNEQMMETGKDWNEIDFSNIETKPYFKELVQAIKEERNTNLIFNGNIYDLDSLNDDDTFLEFIKNEGFCKNLSLVDFFKDILFGGYDIEDNMLPM